jgi:hypothetical protein
MVSKKKSKKNAGEPLQNPQDGNLPEDQVKLKPVLGVRPGVYLAGIYSLIILIALFFALVYPGLSNPGSVAVLDSEPLGAAVRVDGVYRGTTPCEVFVPRGERLIEFILPGFNPRSIETVMPGKVFASVFVPRRTPIAAVLEAVFPLEPLILGAAEYAEWSLAGEPTAVYQVPPSLSEGAYRAGPAAADPLVREAMDGILDASLRFAATRAATRDFLRARFLVDNAGLSPSPITALNSARNILAGLDENPAAAAALADQLGAETAALVRESAWYAGAVSRAASPADGEAGDSRDAFPRPAIQSLEIRGLTFREAAGGSFVTQGSFPRRASAGNFLIANSAAPLSAWEAFLADNPRWNLQNMAVLKEQGLVTEDYLVPFEDGPSGATISSVSWYAAEAFCEWLTTLLPPSLSSYEVRLPTEIEWEYAVSSLSGIRETTGGFWEWCEDPYAPLDFFPAPADAVSLVGSPERSLRGGSWVNQPGSVNIGTRASLPPYICSPFVSFRPVIALKKGMDHE